MAVTDDSLFAEKCKYFGLEEEATRQLLIAIAVNDAGCALQPDGDLVEKKRFFAIYTLLLRFHHLRICEKDVRADRIAVEAHRRYEKRSKQHLRGGQSPTGPQPINSDDPGVDGMVSDDNDNEEVDDDEIALTSTATLSQCLMSGARGTKATSNVVFDVLDPDGDRVLRLSDLVELLFIMQSVVSDTHFDDNRLRNVMCMRLIGDQRQRFRKYCWDHGYGAEMNRVEFVRAWESATDGNASKRTLDLLFGERETIPLAQYLSHCHHDPASHSHQSFALQYCTHMSNKSQNLVALILYVPFLIVFTYFLVAGVGKQESFFARKSVLQATVERTFPSLPEDFPTPVRGVVGNRSHRFRDYHKDDFFLMRSVDDVVFYLQDALLPALWKGEGRKFSSGFIDPLEVGVDPIGALKLRTIRVNGIDDDRDYKRFINGSFTNPQHYDNIEKRYPRTHLGAGVRYSTEGGTNQSSWSLGADNSTVTDPAIRSAHWFPRVVEAFQYRTCAELSGVVLVRGHYRNRYDCDGFALLIPMNDTGVEAQEQLQLALDHKWIDEATVAIIAEQYFYNKDVNAVVYLTLVFEGTPTGYISTTFQTAPFVLEGSNFAVTKGVLFLLYGIYLIVWWLTVFGQIVQHIRFRAQLFGLNTKAAKFFSMVHFFTSDGWNIATIFNLVALTVAWSLRFSFLATFSTLPESVFQTEHYPEGFDLLQVKQVSIEVAEGVSAVFCFLRILKYFSLIPALDVVKRTIANSWQYLLALLFIGGVLFTGFLFCAFLAYANSIVAFSQFDKTATEIVDFMLGQFEFHEWNEKKRFFTPVFFFAFQLLMVLLLLNMVIVVFTDSFNEVQGNSFDSSSVLLLIDNDPTVVNTRPSVSDWIRSSTIVSEIHYFFLKLGNRMMKICAGAERSRQLDKTLVKYQRRNPRTFWRLMTDAMYRLERGTQGEAFAGMVSLTQLMFFGQHERALKGHDLEAFERFMPPAAANAKTVKGFVESQFGGPGSSRMVTHLLVNTPQGHLRQSSTVLLLSMLEFRHYWLKEAEKYKEIDQAQVDNEFDYSDSIGTLDRIISTVAALAPEVPEETAPPASPTEDFRKQSPLERILSTRLKAPSKSSAFSTPLSEWQVSELWKTYESTKRSGLDVDTFADAWNSALFGKADAVDAQSEPTRLHGHLHPGALQRATMPFVDDIFEEDPMSCQIDRDAVLYPAMERGVWSFADLKREVFAKGWSVRELSRGLQFIRIKEGAFGERVVLTRSTFEDLYRVAKEVEEIPEGYTDSIFSPLEQRGENGVIAEEFLSCCTKTNVEALSGRTFLDDFAVKQLQKLQDNVGFVWYLIFIALFAVTILDDRGLGDGAYLGENIVRILNDDLASDPSIVVEDINFNTISNQEEAQRWISAVAVPLMYSAENSSSSSSSTTVGGPLLNGRTHVIGATKWRQNRAQLHGCSTMQDALFGVKPEGSSVNSPWFYEHRYYAQQTEGECVNTFNFYQFETDPYGKFNDTTIDPIAQSAYHFRTCELFSGSGRTIAGPERYYPCSGHGAILPLNIPANRTWTILSQMDNWVDRQTNSIIFELLGFNYNVKLFAKVSMVIVVSPGGSYVTSTDVTVFRGFTVQGQPWWRIALSVAFWVLLLSFVFAFAAFFVGMAREYQTPGVSLLAAMAHVFTSDMWWTLNSLNYILFLVNMAIRIFQAASGGVDVGNFSTFPNEVERVALLEYTVEVIDAANAILSFGRMMFFFRLNPRINMLARTLSIAGQGIASILMLFVLNYTCFALAGYVVFGHTLAAFSTFSDSLLTLFLVLFGDSDYEAMRNERDEIYSFIFFVLYIILSIQILLNLILSSLTSAFVQAKAEVYDTAQLEAVFKNDAEARSEIGTAGFFSEVATIAKAEFTGIGTAIRASLAVKRSGGNFWAGEAVRVRSPQRYWTRVSAILRGDDPWGDWIGFTAAIGKEYKVPLWQHRQKEIEADLELAKAAESKRLLEQQSDADRLQDVDAPSLNPQAQRLSLLLREVAISASDAMTLKDFLHKELSPSVHLQDVLEIAYYYRVVTGMSEFGVIVDALKEYHIRKLEIGECANTGSGDDDEASESDAATSATSGGTPDQRNDLTRRLEELYSMLTRVA